MRKVSVFMQKNKKLIGLLLCLITMCLLLLPILKQLLNNPQLFKQWGMMGKGLLVLIMGLQVVLAFIPSEVVELLAGVLYGPIEGTVLCLLGAALGSILIYLLSARLKEHLWKKEGKEKDFLLNKKLTIPFVFILFLLPGSPKDALTYFMPMTSIKLKPFLVVSSIARIPSVLSSTLTGSVWKQGKVEISLLIYALTAVLSLLGYAIYQRMTKLESQK